MSAELSAEFATFEPDPAASAQHHVPPGLAQMTADLVLTGGQVGEFDFDGKHYRVRVSPESGGHDGGADQLREVTVRSTDRRSLLKGPVLH